MRGTPSADLVGALIPDLLTGEGNLIQLPVDSREPWRLS